jgi:hypothetical protein
MPLLHRNNIMPKYFEKELRPLKWLEEKIIENHDVCKLWWREEMEMNGTSTNSPSYPMIFSSIEKNSWEKGHKG